MLCTVMLAASLMSHASACPGTPAEARVVSLGFGEFAIGLPPRWHIDAGTVVIEIVKYRVTREDGSQALAITMSASPDRGYLGAAARPYCTNGLRGEIETKDGKTTVRLDIPASPDASQRSDTAAYIRFRAGDAKAASVVATAHVPWVTAQCAATR